MGFCHVLNPFWSIKKRTTEFSFKREQNIKVLRSVLTCDESCVFEESMNIFTS